MSIHTLLQAAEYIERRERGKCILWNLADLLSAPLPISGGHTFASNMDANRFLIS